MNFTFVTNTRCDRSIFRAEIVARKWWRHFLSIEVRSPEFFCQNIIAISWHNMLQRKSQLTKLNPKIGLRKHKQNGHFGAVHT